jgi:hypothetical protein
VGIVIFYLKSAPPIAGGFNAGAKVVFAVLFAVDGIFSF